MFSLNKSLNSLKDLDKDELLSYLGLETKRTTSAWVLPSLGVFGLGLLVGAGIGLMLAPKSGNELREDLRQKIQGGPDQLAGSFPSVSSNERSPKSI